MQQLLLFAILGLGTGAITAGLAVALVAFYRGSGVINLSASAVSMVAGFSFWWFKGGDDPFGGGHFGAGFGTPLALVLAIVVSAAVGLFSEYAVFRPLHNAPPLAKLIGSLGILLLAQSVIQLAFGNAPQTEPAILPTTNVQMLQGSVPVVDFILTGVVVAATVLLAVLYRWTNFGLATRAASEDEASAMLAGLSPKRLSLANTMIGCLLCGLLGILAAPLISLDTQNLPLIVVPALGAALFAGFTSVSVACAAGLAIGVVESVVVYLSTQPWFPTDSGAPLPGVADMVVFLIIVGALMWRGTGLPGRGDVAEQRLPIVPRPEKLLQPAIIAAVFGVVALIALPFDFRQALMNSMIGTILVLSLVLMTGFVGQVSLMQLALSGVAGFVVSHAAISAGIGFPLGLILGAVAAVIIGSLVALAALRIRGVTLAVVTLAAAVALQNFGFNNNTWAGGQTGSPVPQPKLFGFKLGNDAGLRGLDGKLPSAVLGFVILGFGIALCLLVANIRRGGLGRQMLAVRSNERASAAIGINVRNVKLLAFAISSMIAGVAGALYSYDFGSVSTNRFSALSALSLIAFAYVGGITMVSGAVIAGVMSVQGLSQYAFQKWFGISGTWTVLVASLAVITTVIFAPAGNSGAFYLKRRERTIRKAANRNAAARKSDDADSVQSPAKPFDRATPRPSVVDSH